MPLPEPADREPVHKRQVVCRGYRRKDGLWDIEGHLIDVKDYTFTGHIRGEVPAGDPIHDMWIRLTIDDDFMVQEIHVAVHKSPYPICPMVIPNFQRLKGIPIARGWRRAVRERLGGTQGCTHLVEMLAPLATAAFQTIYPLQSRQAGMDIATSPNDTKRPMLLGTCHAYAETSPVVKELMPSHHKEPKSDEKSLYDPVS